MSKPSFFAEVKRRNVFKVAIAYAVVGWLLIQVATATFPVCLADAGYSMQKRSSITSTSAKERLPN